MLEIQNLPIPQIPQWTTDDESRACTKIHQMARWTTRRTARTELEVSFHHTVYGETHRGLDPSLAAAAIGSDHHAKHRGC